MLLESATLSIPSELSAQLRSFDRSSLKREPVYYAALDRHGAGFKTHGYVVTGEPGMGLPAGSGVSLQGKVNRYAGRVYHCGMSIMHASFDLNAKIKRAVQESSVISYATKQDINAMPSCIYVTVEEFFRCFLRKAYPERSDEEIFLLAADPDQELQELALLNRKINGEMGAVVARAHTTRRAQEDHKAFMQKGPRLTCVHYPDVDAKRLKELFRQEQLRQRFLDERLAIGKATSINVKKQKRPSVNASTLDRFVKYVRFPFASNPGEANCNKASATLLQEALNASVSSDRVSAVRGITFFNYGASQRMSLWDPTGSLKARVCDIIRNKDMSLPPADLQTLADNKADIFMIINEMPDDAKLEACHQALNKDTLLGRIFHAKRTVCYMSPSIYSGYLAKVKALRDSLTEEKESSSLLLGGL